MNARWKAGGVALLLAGATGVVSQASSHREAPGIAKTPRVDGTDFYMFRSFEPGRSGYVTLLANYIGLEDGYGGPNFFMLDQNAVYEIHIDNNADAAEDVTFQFRFQNTPRNIALNVGGKSVAVPLLNVGRVGPAAADNAALNVVESYTVDIIRGARRSGPRQALTNAATGEATFLKPVDRIGDKSIRDVTNTAASVPPNANYAGYAENHLYTVNIPGCDAGGRVFVGQRREGFVVNLAETFDLINTNPLGPRDAEENNLADKNVTTLALEVPIACLTASPTSPIIGGWTTASLGATPSSGGGGDVGPCPAGLPPIPSPGPGFVPTQDCMGYVPVGHPSARQTGPGGGAPTGALSQVSRLGSPLVNEVVIGLKDKDRFNASEPKDDGQFIDYVTNPTMPAIIEALFGFAGVRAPTVFPRADLIAAFLTGVQGLNKPTVVGTSADCPPGQPPFPSPGPGFVPTQDCLGYVPIGHPLARRATGGAQVPGEMLRLNTSIAPVAAAQQNSLGVLGGDTAGFPNGRRPGDDVVDIELRVLMGALLPASQAPSGALPYTDGALVNAMIAYDPEGTVTPDLTLRLFRDSFPYLQLPLSASPNPTHQ
jgi:uncharacterized protein DUF4331